VPVLNFGFSVTERRYEILLNAPPCYRHDPAR
jgi:hypothetical protein